MPQEAISWKASWHGGSELMSARLQLWRVALFVELPMASSRESREKQGVRVI